MAGTVIDVMRKRELSFDSGAATYVLAKAIPSRGWAGGGMFVRVHSKAITSSSTLAIQAFLTAPTAQNPDLDFIRATAIATITLTQFTTAPSLLLTNFSTHLGQFLLIRATGTPSGGTCSAELSIELVLKADDPQPGDRPVPRIDPRFP